MAKRNNCTRRGGCGNLITFNRQRLNVSKPQLIWNPNDLNPDMYFDSKEMNFFENNSFGDSTTYYKTASLKNLSLSGVGIDFNQTVLANKPMLMRQYIGGYNSINYNGTSNYLQLLNYSAINYTKTDSFFIALSIRTTTTLSRIILDSTNSTTGRGGIRITINNTTSGKIGLIFYDTASANKFGVELNTSINDDKHHTVVFKYNGSGLPSGITGYINGVLVSLSIIYSDLITDINGGNGYFIGKQSNSATFTPFSNSVLFCGKNNITQSDIISFDLYCKKQIRWDGVISQSPVLNGYTGKLSYQSYPPFIFKEGSTYYALAVSGDSICSWSSPDGVVFTQQNIVLTPGPGWDAGYISNPVVRKIGSTFYLFYFGATTNTNYKLGYATSTSPITGYTKYVSNPLFTVTDYNAVFNRNMEGVIVSDILNIDGTIYWFGTSVDESRCDVWYGTSAAITIKPTPQTILFKGADADYMRSLIQLPRVFKTTWGWIMHFTVSSQQNDYQERNIRSAYCIGNNPTSFVLLDEDIINSGVPGKWDERRVYADYFLCHVDDDEYFNLLQVSGYYHQYYSGHTLTPGGNTGLSGLNKHINIPDIRNGRLPSSIIDNADAGVKNIGGILAYIEADNNCFYSPDTTVFQIHNSADKNNTLIGVENKGAKYTANGINNLPSLSFTGTEVLKFGKGLDNPSSFTQFLVVKTTNMAALQILSGGADITGTNASTLNTVQITALGAIRAAISDSVSTNLTLSLTANGVVVVNTPLLITITYNNGDNFIKIYKDGVLQTTSEALNTAYNTGSVVKNWVLGRAGENTTYPFKGLMSFFGVYNKVLTSGELSVVHSYLINKYGI